MKRNRSPASAAAKRLPQPAFRAAEKRISPASKGESESCWIETQVGDLSLLKSPGCAKAPGAVLAANKYTARTGRITAARAVCACHINLNQYPRAGNRKDDCYPA